MSLFFILADAPILSVEQLERAVTSFTVDWLAVCVCHILLSWQIQSTQSVDVGQHRDVNLGGNYSLQSIVSALSISMIRCKCSFSEHGLYSSGRHFSYLTVTWGPIFTLAWCHFLDQFTSDVLSFVS
jgi:hypothetical protein